MRSYVTSRLSHTALLVAALLIGNTCASQRVEALKLPLQAKVSASSNVITKKPAPKSQLPAGMTFITDIEGIREYRLKNGLKILLFPDASQSTFTLNMTYLVGSRHEGYGETGMVHMLKHMMFKGTPSRGQLLAALKKRGAKYSGTTNTDRTNYLETLTKKGDNLAWAIALEADRMVNSKMSAADLKTIKNIVMNEQEKDKKSAMNLLYKRVSAVAYDWHNYGNSSMGNRHDVLNVSTENLKAFYKKYYQPDNAVVTLSGHFNTKEALELIAKYFGKIPKPKRPSPQLWTKEHIQDGERSVILRRSSHQQVLMAAYHVPSALHSDTPALTVLNQLLTDQSSGKLYQALVQSKLASGVGSVSGNRVDPSLLLYLVTLNKKSDVAVARVRLLNTLEGAARNQFTEADVRRVRQQLVQKYKQQLVKPEKVGLTLSEAIALGDWRLYFYFRDQLLKVTAKDVNRVATKYFKPSNRTLGQLIPEDRPDLVEMTPAPSAAEVLKKYVGYEAKQSGEQLDSSPLAIEKRVKRTTIAGVKVALLPQKNRSKRVYLQMNLNFGNPQTATTGADAAFFVGALLTRGSQGMTRQQLKDRLEEYKSTLNVTSGVTGASIRINTERQYVPQVLKLLQKVLREPSFSKSEFDLLRKASIAGLSISKKNNNRVASLRLARAFMPTGASRGNLSYIRSVDENIADLQALKVNDVSEYYKKIWNASHAQLAVVGDFEPEIVKKAIPSLVKGFKSQVKYRRIVFPLVKPQGKSIVVNMSGQTNATYAARSAFALREDAVDAPALMVAMQIFGVGNTSRLWQRVRIKDGMSNGIGANIRLNSSDQRALYTISASYNSKFHQKMAKTIQDELGLVIKNGFTAKEVKMAQSSLLETARISRSQDATLADQLTKQLFLGRTYQFDAQMEARIKKVTPQTALAAFKKYIHPQQLVIVRVGSFSKGNGKISSQPKTIQVRPPKKPASSITK